MKAKGWFATALVAGGIAMTVKMTGGCLNRPAPDQKLASEFEDLCEIARKGADKPVAGVKALGKYLVLHAGDMAKNLLDTIGMIERIADDEAHDERARIARDRWMEEACPADMNRFDEAITNSPEATELVEKAAIRVNRTFEILFGNGVRLRDLPERMIERLPASLR
jgi:hypothetical protein